MTEILTSFCARRYGRSAAAYRVGRMVAAAAVDPDEDAVVQIVFVVQASS